MVRSSVSKTSRIRVPKASAPGESKERQGDRGNLYRDMALITRVG